ncbi:MAG: helix-turn-helix domain-containing protein [Lysobacteraceae bacterium]
MNNESASVLDLTRIRKSCAQCSLHQLCLPAGIAADDLNRLDELVKKRKALDRGDRLFRVGSPLTSLFVARSGSFKTVAMNEDGDEQIIGFHLPGEIIGLDGLGSGQHRCDAEALETAELCEIPMQDLERVALQIPELQHQMLRVIGRSMDRDQDHLEMLGRRHASERVLLFVHGLSERLRMLGRQYDAFTLPMSREEIASYLGLVIETVSRSFTRLQEDGIISIRGRQLRILDLHKLDQIAHSPEVHRARG